MIKSKGVSRVILCFYLLALPCIAATRSYAGPGTGIFKFDVIETREISGRFTVARGRNISIDWGDGTGDTFTEGRRQNFSKDYGKDANVQITIYAEDESALEEFRITQRRANISFDLKDLPRGLKVLHLNDSNTATGDVGDLPLELTYFYVRGNNTVKGDISALPEGLTYFHIHGSNTVTGDIGGLPRGLTYFYVRGDSAVTGDIAKLPEGLSYFYARGDNTVTGDIGKLPLELTHFSIFDSNTVTGDIAELPEGLILFVAGGDNTVKGDIGKLPRGMTHLGIDGSNTVSGNIAELPADLIHLFAAGNNRISGYTPGRKWADRMIRVELRPSRGYGLNREEVDSLLTDLSVVAWSDRGVVFIGEGNQSRTGASDSAVSALEGMGVNVTAN